MHLGKHSKAYRNTSAFKCRRQGERISTRHAFLKCLKCAEAKEKLTFLMRCKREKILLPSNSRKNVDFTCSSSNKTEFSETMIYELVLRNFDCSLEFVFSLLLLQRLNFSPVSFACNFQDWGCVILREIDFLLKICWSIPCLHPSWKVHAWAGLFVVRHVSSILSRKKQHFVSFIRQPRSVFTRPTRGCQLV